MTDDLTDAWFAPTDEALAAIPDGPPAYRWRPSLNLLVACAALLSLWLAASGI